MDENDVFLSSLTTPEMSEQDVNGGWIDEDTTAQSFEVTLPDKEDCIGCTVSRSSR